MRIRRKTMLAGMSVALAFSVWPLAEAVAATHASIPTRIATAAPDTCATAAEEERTSVISVTRKLGPEQGREWLHGRG
jgi:hypothetical protein